MGGGGNHVVKSTNTYEIQIVSAGYQKPAKTGKNEVKRKKIRRVDAGGKSANYTCIQYVSVQC